LALHLVVVVFSAMGAVHGVYAKYVGLSVGSLGTFLCLKPEEVAHAELPLLCVLVSLLYASCLNAVIAALFRLESCMGILGKDESTGAVPAWSYVLFAPFHLPTFLYTAASRQRDVVTGVSVADEVAAGWWLGGRYASELRRQWSGIIDLTCEFPERCAGSEGPGSYLLLRCWDGVPPTPQQLEEAASFALRRRPKGDVVVHCAHGRGRSTTVMCACLVKAGLFESWPEAFDAISVAHTRGS